VKGENEDALGGPGLAVLVVELDMELLEEMRTKLLKAVIQPACMGGRALTLCQLSVN